MAVTPADAITPNGPKSLRRKSVKCAEALIPKVVGPEHFLRIIVGSHDAREAVRAMGCSLPISIDYDLFFQNVR